MEIMDYNRYLSSFPKNTMFDATTIKDKDKNLIFLNQESLGVLYEFINGNYVRTEDMEFNPTKTYFINVRGTMTEVVD
jgi:hypothetical protein